MPAHPEFLLLYDEECPVCRAATRAVLGLARTRIRPVGLRSPEAERLLGDETADERLAVFHLVGPDGQHWKGPEALPPLLEQLRWLWPAGRQLHRSPLLHRAAAGAYHWVTRNRGRLARLIPPSWGRPLEQQRRPDVPL